MSRARAFSTARAQIGEIQAMAQAMAAASVGLRGWEAKAAQQAAKQKHRERRWRSIVKAANARLERIILRDYAEFEERKQRVLSRVASVKKSC